MRVVVVGGGFGGLAAAARLSKLGHEVTLLERAQQLGGALVSESHGDFSWNGGPHAMLLPAVVRDLFRKSGRPIERELDLVEHAVIREHRFEDGSRVQLPGSSKVAQIAAFDDLGPGLGQAWAQHVASYAADWEVLRRGYFEMPWVRGELPRDVADRLRSRESLHRRLRRTLKDERLRLVAGHPFAVDGHELRDVPAWAGLVAYLEQRFGAWTVQGGMGMLADALARRLATRGVSVLLGTEAMDVVVRQDHAVAVATAGGEVAADAVVCAVDPRRLPVLAPYVRATTPALPPVTCHLGLEGEVPELPAEVVLHGDPTLVVRTSGIAPPGHAAWTVHARGRVAEDLPTALARHGIDVRRRVVVQRAYSPRDLVEQWGGSPLGVLWQGRSTVTRRLGPTTPVRGVYAAGAHATPGSGLPFVGLSAALVAQEIGPAD